MEKIMGDYIQTRDIVMCEKHMDEGLTESCLYCHIEKLKAILENFEAYSQLEIDKILQGDQE